MRVDEGTNKLEGLLENKTAGACRSGEGGQEPFYIVTPCLSLRLGREKEKEKLRRY